MTKTYDPGTQGRILPRGNGVFLTESFRDKAGTWYTVDLANGTCTCAHHRKTGAVCKHQTACRHESYRRTLRTAANLDLLTLRRELERPGRRPEVREAISQTIEKRAERLIDGGGF